MDPAHRDAVVVRFTVPSAAGAIDRPREEAKEWNSVCEPESHNPDRR